MYDLFRYYVIPPIFLLMFTGDIFFFTLKPLFNSKAKTIVFQSIYFLALFFNPKKYWGKILLIVFGGGGKVCHISLFIPLIVIETLGICHDEDSIKQGYLFY